PPVPSSLRRHRALALFLLLALLWGAPYALIKVSVEELSPWTLGCARVAIGAAVLVPVALARGAFAGIRRRHLPWIALVGCIQMAAPLPLSGAGEQYLPSSRAGRLIWATPLFLALRATAIDAAGRPTRTGAAGLALGLAGVGVLLGVDLGGGEPLLGGALMLL